MIGIRNRCFSDLAVDHGAHTKLGIKTSLPPCLSSVTSRRYFATPSSLGATSQGSTPLLGLRTSLGHLVHFERASHTLRYDLSRFAEWRNSNHDQHLVTVLCLDVEVRRHCDQVSIGLWAKLSRDEALDSVGDYYNFPKPLTLKTEERIVSKSDVPSALRRSE